ncbi:MAG: hypothetical protein WA102_09845 [Candidatus Methanoperedens sp.]
MNDSNANKMIVFTKDGMIVPERVENLIQGVTWKPKLVPYSEIKQIGTLNLKVDCIQPEFKGDTLIALKMQGEFERKTDKSTEIIGLVTDRNESDGEILTTLSKIDVTNRFPRFLITPDGQKRSTTSWAGILVEVANYLELINKINASIIPILDSSRRSRHLISCENKHLSGSKFIGKHATQKGLHIETNYRANDIVKNAIHLIEYCKENPSQFRVVL